MVVKYVIGGICLVFWIYSFIMSIKSNTRVEQLRHDRNSWVAIAIMNLVNVILS